MKKTIILLGLFSMFIATKAQMTLKQTFEVTHTEDFTYFLKNVQESPANPNTVKYILYSSKDNSVKIFNPDFSLHKIVPIEIPAGYDLIYNIIHASTKAFNSDEKVEFIILFRTPQYTIHTQFLNEDGELIKEYSGQPFIHPYVYINNNEFRINIGETLINSDGSITNKWEVYTLGGTVPTNTQALSVTEKRNPFPNPSRSVVNLPYNLKSQNQAIMTIFNSKGAIIERKKIDKYFDKIQLDVSGYNPGMYIYEYNGISNKFVVN